MKKYVIIFICLAVSFMTFGQNAQMRLKEIRVTPPKFTGIINVMNEKSLTDYLHNNIKYKISINEPYDEGTEVVKFVVTPDGRLTNFKIINSVSNKIDKEVIRVLETTNGMWVPGLNDKEAIAMEKEISVLFCIYENGNVANHFTSIATKYFIKGTKNLLIKNKPKRALTAFKKASKYLPYDKAILYSRSLAKYLTGDEEGAHNDQDRLKFLVKTGNAKQDLKMITYNNKTPKGYKEFLSFIEE